MARKRSGFHALPVSRAVGAGAITLGALGFFELARAMASADNAWSVRERHVRRWARWMLRVAGVTVYAEPLPREVHGAQLVVANHRSPYDIPILLALFGGHPLSRADLARWPVLGIAARHTETLFVDRGDRSSGARAIRDMRSRLEMGHRVVVFPEGTTHRGDDVREFHGGAFAAIAGLKAEIVPVGLAYPPHAEWEGEPMGEHLGRVGRERRLPVSVAVGEPFPVAGRARALAEASRNAVQALVATARAGAFRL